MTGYGFGGVRLENKKPKADIVADHAGRISRALPPYRSYSENWLDHKV